MSATRASGLRIGSGHADESEQIVTEVPLFEDAFHVGLFGVGAHAEDLVPVVLPVAAKKVDGAVAGR